MAIWILVAAAGVWVVHSLPDIYISEAVILVDSQQIPEKFVSATVDTDLQDRISLIRQQILSSGDLKAIIRDFNLYQKQRRTHPDHEILELMRKDVIIDRLDSTGRPDRPLTLHVGYRGSNPVLVTNVANRITALYIQENVKSRQVQAAGTSEFLNSQVQEAKQRLDVLEAAVSSYKIQHTGELPQQQESISATLSRLQLELESNRDAINRTQQSKIMVESSLSAADVTLAAELRAIEQPATTASSPQQPRSEILAHDLAVLRARYREDHPEVVRLRRELEAALKAEEQVRVYTAGLRRTAASMLPTAQSREITGRESAELTRIRGQITALQTQILATEQELESRKADQQRILRDISIYQGRLERLPLREQEMAQITRDYEMSKENYRTLLDKKMAAGVALDMERKEKSERFRVLDPATVPDHPVKPKRLVLNGVVLFAALLVGLALAFALELRSNVFLGEWELAPNITILARLPQIVIPSRPSSGDGELNRLPTGGRGPVA